MSKISTYAYTIPLLLMLCFQMRFTAGSITKSSACDAYNISHTLHNDTLTVNFLSNHLLKLNRRVQCTSTSSWEQVNGWFHHCPNLTYGQHEQLSIEMQHDNGTNETCFIHYTTEVQAATVAYFNVTGYNVRLGINRPQGSFDHVLVRCSQNESYILFAEGDSTFATVDCSFLLNMPLISVVLETVKNDFHSNVLHISQEIPLPIPFIYSLDSLSLTIKADRPPPINLNSTYELQILFSDQNYQRINTTGFQYDLPSTFTYGLIPNFKHTILFKHIVESIGYAQSNTTIFPISNRSYPFAVTNLRLEEAFHQINVTWTDPHPSNDPVEFIVTCQSSTNVQKNTTYICEQITLDELEFISVETRLAIPGYTHDRTVVVQLNVSQIPDILGLTIVNTSESSVTLRWNANVFSSFNYQIQCGTDKPSFPLDSQTNEYQCRELDHGTLYTMTVFIANNDSTIQRSKSILTNTLLQKCQYRNHVYSVDSDDKPFVIIEWSPPEKNFDQIHVVCPSERFEYAYVEVRSIMHVKCVLINVLPFQVTFSTRKSGYDEAIFQLIDTPTTKVSRTESELSKWRLVAIVAWIICAFFVLAVICLTIFLCLRIRSSAYRVDE